MKRFAALTILLVVLFTAMSLYRTNVVELPRDAEYAEMHGLEEDGDEW